MVQQDPLFVPSRQALLEALRLGNAPAGAPIHRVLDEVILAVRLRLQNALTISRVQGILATPWVERPGTSAQHLRALGSIVEMDMVRLELFDRDEVFLREAAGGAQQRWNEEGFARGLDPLEREARIGRLRAKIQENLAYLSQQTPVGDPTPTETTRVFVSPTPTNARKPFDMIFPT